MVHNANVSSNVICQHFQLPEGVASLAQEF